MLGDFLDHLDVELRFVVVEEPTLNAWAYPYGTIGIHTGLLVRMDNEAQLAAIVSHEISHFLQRHTYREMLSKGRQGLFGKGLGILASAALARETGTFDPNVGNFAGDLWFKNDCDAIAVIRVAVIQAPIENDKVEWDGASEEIKKKGGGLKYTASVAASSISVSIFDVAERPLFVNYGGLEVLVMRVRKEFQPLDASEYFQDEKRIKKAVQTAMKPI